MDEKGQHAFYSEVGAPLIVCAPSSGEQSRRITTLDVMGDEGYNPNEDDEDQEDYENKNYTKMFGGTSAAAPIVTGVVALMLEANPYLGWRDVRIILARSARATDPHDPDWSINGDGLKINHKYGFGVVDAQAAVDMAKTWSNVGQEGVTTVDQAVNSPVPDNDAAGLTSDIVISEDRAVEFVDVVLDIPDYPKIGDLGILGTPYLILDSH